MTQPWEVRFKPIMSEIHSSIQSVHRLMQLLVSATVYQLNEKTSKIETAFKTGIQDLTAMNEEGHFLILKNQKELGDQIQTLVNKLNPSRDCKSTNIWDEAVRDALLAGMYFKALRIASVLTLHIRTLTSRRSRRHSSHRGYRRVTAPKTIRSTFPFTYDY